MRYKPLTSHETIAVQAALDGYSQPEAYLKAFKNAARWLPVTLQAKSRAYFKSARIRYYIDVLSGEVAEELPELTTKEEALDHAFSLGGRPTTYYPELVGQLIAYFDVPPYVSVKYENKKTGNMEYATKVNSLPTKAGFAAKVGIYSGMLDRWAKDRDENGKLINPEFAMAYKLADDYQQNLLITNTLMGEYQSSFAIFVAKNLLGWRDSKDESDSGNPDKPLEIITKEMTTEQAALIYKEFTSQD